MPMQQRVSLLAAALWWGGLTTVFWAAPLLFAHLPTPAVAGAMAARLFSASTWLALGCGVLILMLSRPRGEHRMSPWGGPLLGWVLGGMLLALLVEFAAAPRIMARENLKLWHGLASGMLLLEWACAGLTLWKLARPAPVTPLTPPASQGD